MIRDTDADEDRHGDAGLHQARAAIQPALTNCPRPIPVVGGVAHTMRECWALAGFDPEPGDEEEALAAERQRLGCDPRVESESLTATKDDQAVRNPKRVHAALIGSAEREARCLSRVDILGARGRANGLTAFIAELRSLLIPALFGGPPAGRC